MQSIFIACSPPIHLSSTWASENHWSFTISTDLFFPEWYLIGIIHCRLFWIGFLHLLICICDSSISFLGLILHLFLVLNNIPLSGWTPVHLIYLFKDIVVAFTCLFVAHSSWGEWMIHSCPVLCGLSGLKPHGLAFQTVLMVKEWSKKAPSKSDNSIYLFIF